MNSFYGAAAADLTTAVTVDWSSGVPEILIVDVATGSVRRVELDRWTSPSEPRFQPRPYPLPWSPWSPPGPDVTPEPVQASITVDIDGAFEAATTLAGTCYQRGDEVEIEATTSELGFNVAIAGDGTVTFLSVNGDGFAAFAGKFFEIAPPTVVTAPGSTSGAGSVTLKGVPSDDGPGTIDGTISWSCGIP